MSRGLNRRPFQVFNGGGIDTKTDKRLVPAGELVEIENMYMLKTGELRMRNGFAALPAGSPTGGLDRLFTLPGGILGGYAINWNTFGVPHVPVKYVPGVGGVNATWAPAQPVDTNSATTAPAPVATVRLSGVEAMQTSPTATASDLVDPDMAIIGNAELVTWTDPAIGSNQRFQIRTLTGQPLNSDQFTDITSGTGRPPVTAPGGTTYLCAFVVASGAPASIKAYVWNSDGGILSSTTIAAAGVSAAQPWIDAKSIPGTNNIAIAFRATGGGVTCGIFNPATGLLGTTVNTAAADASMCLGFLDDSLATGNMYLATAGAGAGVVVRTMSATTMVVSATNVISATATTLVRNVTGYIATGAANYVVLWDQAPAASYAAFVVRGAWTGAATVFPHARQYTLYSRAFKAADGYYYYFGAYDSTTQPTYAMIAADFHGDSKAPIAAIVMPQHAGGRRNFVCSLSSATTTGGLSYLALAAKQRTVIAAGVVGSVRSISSAAVSVASAGLMRPRELGGTVFFPGGLVNRDDGKWNTWATFPLYPEPPTLVSGAVGSMTPGGAYSYRLVLKRIDITGRISRSASSLSASITLGGADTSCALTIPNPKQLPIWNRSTAVAENPFIEVYRAGPGASGASAYNKVGELSADYAGADTLAFVDTLADSDAALGEFIYSTGNVLEGFVTPSCKLLEVNGGRVGIVNAEDPSQFWPSLEYKPGQGLRFNPLLAIGVTGDGYGDVTALGAMDGRWILFKSSAIYVISGDGPNDVGQGSFSAPQACSLSIGTVLPGSVVATPDGLMFQAAAGIYLLDRGLGLTYIGAPVEQYTLAENVADASLVSGVTQVRFVLPSGRCLAWDYHHKRWYTFALRVDASTVTACTDSPSGWCYALADGTVMRETAGVYSDVKGTTTAIAPRVGFPALALAGINGFERFYGVDILGELVGNHTLAIDFEYDYGGAVTETRTFVVAGAAGTGLQVEVLPATQKVTSVKITLRTSALAAGSGAFRLSGLTLWGGLKKGSSIPYTKRAS